MDDRRVGRAIRAVRHRLRWRQVDLGDRAGLSQDEVSLAERGHLEGMTLRSLRRICTAVEADLVLLVRWRGGDLDRLLDEGHAALIAKASEVLQALGWETSPELTFAVYGERGSIDIVAWHALTRTLIVVEVKTELTSLEETLRTHDTKVRLAPGVVAERLGWHPLQVGRLLVLPDASTPRRRVARHDRVLASVYPERGEACRAWLREPRAGGGILFLSPTSRARASSSPVSRKRISRARREPASAADTSGARH